MSNRLLDCLTPGSLHGVVLAAVTMTCLAITGLRAQEHVTFFVNDDLGSPIVALSATGATLWRADYDPFGDMVAQSGAIPTNRRWLGLQFDKESQLYAMGSRMYHPKIGRFLSPDPLLVNGGAANGSVAPAGLNLYAYAINNPMRYHDKTGNAPEPAVSAPPSQKGAGAKIKNLGNMTGLDSSLVDMLAAWEKEGTFDIHIDVNGGMRTDPKVQKALFDAKPKQLSNAATLEETPHGYGAAIDVNPKFMPGDVTPKDPKFDQAVWDAIYAQRLEQMAKWVKQKYPGKFLWGGDFSGDFKDMPHFEIVDFKKSIPFPSSMQK